MKNTVSVLALVCIAAGCSTSERSLHHGSRVFRFTPPRQTRYAEPGTVEEPIHVGVYTIKGEEIYVLNQRSMEWAEVTNWLVRIASQSPSCFVEIQVNQETSINHLLWASSAIQDCGLTNLSILVLGETGDTDRALSIDSTTIRTIE